MAAAESVKAIESKVAQWLSSTGREQWRRAAKLRRRSNDPESTPFKSKYEAAEIYARLIGELKTFCDLSAPTVGIAEQSLQRYYLLLFALRYELGQNHIETEDMVSGEREFRNCIGLIREQLRFRFLVDDFDSNEEESELKINTASDNNDDDERSEAPAELNYILVNLLNQLGCLKSIKLHFAAALPFLVESERLFFAWKSNLDASEPLSFTDIFDAENSANSIAAMSAACARRRNEIVDREKCAIAKSHTITMYYMAQAYQQIGEYDNSARNCHATLREQYRYLPDIAAMHERKLTNNNGDDYDDDDDRNLAKDPILSTFDHVEWSMNAAMLSQYFSANDQFDAARHLLCCGRAVWLQTPPAIKSLNGTGDDRDCSERWRMTGAHLDRMEVKYCLLILRQSFELMRNDELKRMPAQEYQFKAYLLNLPEIEEAEKRFPGYPVRDYAAAKQVFRVALSAIESAKRYFTLDEHASDYVDCTFDHSALYDAIIPYDPVIDNRCKMTKRRIDMLEALVDAAADHQLNPQYFLPQCRKIHYELGEIYARQVSLKMIAAQSTTGDGDDRTKLILAMRKINSLSVRSIQHYHQFLSSFAFLNAPNGCESAANPALRINRTPAESVLRIAPFVLPARIEMQNETKNINSNSNNNVVVVEDGGYLESIISAYVAIGRMHTKMVCATAAEHIPHWRRCQDYFTQVEDYLHRNCDQRRERFEDYHTQVSEMLALIPDKIKLLVTQQQKQQPQVAQDCSTATATTSVDN